MKILIVTQNRWVVGGIETYLQAVAPRLTAAGHTLGWLFGDSATATSDREVIAGDPQWSIEDDSRDRIIAAVATWRPDIVYSHGLADPHLEAALAARFPTIYYAHGYFGTCVSGTKCHAHLGYRTCQRSLGPTCLAVYLPFGCGGKSPLAMLRLYQTERQRQANLGAFRYVVVASRHMAEEYRRHGVPADRIQIVSLFAPEVTPLENPPTPQGRSNRILLMGRLTRLKGGDHLIEALPLAADRLGRRLTLMVAGDGSERPRLETLARRRGVPAEFHGWVSGPKRDVITRGVDLIAVPSLWPEPFGLVGIEAGCLGVPAIGYAVGGIPDWLIPGVSGESAPGDALVPDSLADAIVRALADDHHWNRLRHGAWETARRFSPEAHLQKLEQIFQHAVG